MIGQFNGRQKTNVYGWVSDLAVARSGFNQIGVTDKSKRMTYIRDQSKITKTPLDSCTCMFWK